MDILLRRQQANIYLKEIIVEVPSMATTQNGNQIGNFDKIMYNPGHDTSGGARQRIGISATEVELLDDVPTTFSTGAANFSNTINQQNPSSHYQTLSFNREQPRANIVYPDGNSQEIDTMVNRLLEKYAPEYASFSIKA